MRIEDAVRESLRRRADAVHADEHMWRGIVNRERRGGERPSRAGRVLMAAAALLIGLGSVAFLARAFRGERTGTAGGSASPEVRYTKEEIRLTPGIAKLIVAEGLVWVVEPGGVARIDATTGETLTHVLVEGVSEYSGLAVGDGMIWVTAQPDIVGIDPASNAEVRRFSVQTGITTVAFLGNRLIYGGSAEGNGDLVAVDAQKGEILGSVLTGGQDVSAILQTPEGIWVGHTQHSQPYGAGLSRVSTDFSQVVAVDGVDAVSSLAWAGGRVWAVSDGSLYAIDPERAKIVGSFASPRLLSVAGDGEHLWILTETGSTSKDIYLPDPDQPALLIQLDPATATPVGEPVALDHFTPASLSAANGQAWVSFYDDGVLVRVRPLEA